MTLSEEEREVVERAIEAGFFADAWPQVDRNDIAKLAPADQVARIRAGIQAFADGFSALLDREVSYAEATEVLGLTAVEETWRSLKM